MTPLSRMIDSFLQCALEMGKRGCTAPELDLWANIIAALLTVAAILTRNTCFYGYTITLFQVDNLASERHHASSGFVALTQWFLDPQITVGEMIEVV